MKFDYQRRQKNSMCEIISNQILDRDPSLINKLDVSLPHPLINRFVCLQELDDAEEKDF